VPRLKELVLSHGRVFASGRAFVPFVKASLFLQLQTAAQAASDTNRSKLIGNAGDGSEAEGRRRLNQSPRQLRRGAKRRAAGRTSMWAVSCFPGQRASPLALIDAVRLGLLPEDLENGMVGRPAGRPAADRSRGHTPDGGARAITDGPAARDH